MGLFWCGNLNNTPFRSHYLPPFLKVKTPRHSLGRPSRSDLVQLEDNVTNIFKESSKIGSFFHAVRR